MTCLSNGRPFIWSLIIDSSTEDGSTENFSPASVSIIFLLSEPEAKMIFSDGIMNAGIKTCLLSKFLRRID
jgi:hypothetical protein